MPTNTPIIRAAAGVLLLGLALTPRVAAQSGPAPVDLVCEYKTNPIGIDIRLPRLSWKVPATARGWTQRAYQIQVATSSDRLESERDLAWDSGRVDSGASTQRPYGGQPVHSSERYYWRVRVWDAQDLPSPWSEIASWEMGLLDPADWSAAWITPDWEKDASVAQPAPMLRRAFHVDGELLSARLYITSLGLYRAEINGQTVGDQLFTPGWTAYRHRLQYQTYDVTTLVRRGANVIGATLGDGWYRGVIGFEEQRGYYGDRLGLRAQLRLVFENGDIKTIGTDERWSAGTGGIRSSDIYMGEVYDARRQPREWSSPGFDDSAWSGVRRLPAPDIRLIAPEGPPVRRVQEVRPVRILRTPGGDTVFDLGQNMVGWVRLRVSAAGVEAGHAITLRHAEVLDRDGNFYTENLRAARQEVRYILDGTEHDATFEPHFTFQGFRYVAIDGYPGQPTLDSLTGIVIHSDLPRTGTFEVSNPMLNQLQHNIVWGQKGNFLDVPTDCPQRDERMGWTGDAQVFARTAAFNMGVAGFFTKWLGDLAADQHANGSVPFVIPDVLSVRSPQPGGGPDASGSGAAGAAGWADAGVIIPWTLYLTYGDTRVLEQQYDSMKAWVEYERGRAGPDLIWSGDFHFGDWLAYSTNDPAYPGATTGTDLIATAFFAHSADLLARTARILGRQTDAETYARLFEDTAEAFRREFVTETGRVGENTQTAYALALMFDLLPTTLRAEAARRLADDVRARDTHLTTGFLGTPYLNHVLTRFGYLDVAYGLLLQDSYPSWLYPITQGATTIWERWDGQKPDGTFQSPSMNSFNHYAYGAVGDWMYRVVAGIDTSESAPGYKHILIAPQPGGDLTSARGTLETMYGIIESSWTVASDRFSLDVTIPANTTATVRLPHARIERVTESGGPLGAAAGVTGSAQDGDATVVEIGSGVYHFNAARN